MTTPEDLTTRLREFTAAREWSRFHTPKNLAMAIAGESGELAAEYQWLTPEESEASAADGELRDRVAGEMADVAIYLLLLADRLELDLFEIVRQKIDVNERRFPTDRLRDADRVRDG